VKIELKNKHPMLFFSTRCYNCGKTKFFIFSTSLISIEWMNPRWYESVLQEKNYKKKLEVFLFFKKLPKEYNVNTPINIHTINVLVANISIRRLINK
jgi:hypothetical protein